MKPETMTPRQRFETAINLQEPDRVPVCQKPIDEVGRGGGFMNYFSG